MIRKVEVKESEREIRSRIENVWLKPNKGFYTKWRVGKKVSEEGDDINLKEEYWRKWEVYLRE